jgi:hypothetical protein
MSDARSAIVMGAGCRRGGMKGESEALRGFEFAASTVPVTRTCGECPSGPLEVKVLQ